MAAGVLKVANQKKIAIPHQLSLTGFDDAPISRHLWPSITTVRQPVQEMATKALEMLIKLIRNDALDNQQPQFDSTVIVRESSAPVINN